MKCGALAPGGLEVSIPSWNAAGCSLPLKSEHLPWVACSDCWRFGVGLTMLWPSGFCRGAPSLLPVLLGAGGAAGFARYRGVQAVPAESKSFGLTPLFLGKEPFLIPALRCLVPSAVVLATPLPGFNFGGGRFRASLRRFGLRGALSWRGAGGVFPWQLSSRFCPAGRAAARVARLRQVEAELEGSPCCT